MREVFALEPFVQELAALCPCPVVPVGRDEMARISAQTTPEGVLAVCEIPPAGTPDFSPGRIVLALDRVRDPGNLGTIIRTADWFGVRDVVCSDGTVDVYNPKTVQSTMGSIARVRVHYTDNLAGLLSACPLPVLGTFLGGEDIFRAEIDPGEGAVVVIGNEAGGICPEVAEVVDRRLTIPRYGEWQRAESLNAAVAASIVVAQLCSRVRGKG